MLSNNLTVARSYMPKVNGSNKSYKCPGQEDKTTEEKAPFRFTKEAWEKSAVTPSIAVAVKNLVPQRMYVFVLSQLSPLDKGIQAAHAIANLSLHDSEEYNRWVKKDKTLIILNGGNTSTMREHWDTIHLLMESDKIPGCVASFQEENLDGITTAIAVLVDEQVFDRKKYPLANEYCDGDNTWSMPLNRMDILNRFGTMEKYELAKFITSQRLAH